MENNYKVTLIMENGDKLVLPSTNIDFTKYDNVSIKNHDSIFYIDDLVNLSKLNKELNIINQDVEINLIYALTEYIVNSCCFFDIFDIKEENNYIWLPSIKNKEQLVNFYLEEYHKTKIDKNKVNYKDFSKWILKSNFNDCYYFTKNGFIAENY